MRSVLDNPVSATEVHGWFAEAIRSGKIPSEELCSRLADFLNERRENKEAFPWLPARPKKKSKINRAYDLLILELESEIESVKHWEKKMNVRRSPYSVTLSRFLRQITLQRLLVIDPQEYGLPSDLQTNTLYVAGMVLRIWNKTRGKATTSIGRETPCEAVLVRAMSRIANRELAADGLRSEIARSKNQDLLRLIGIPKRED